LRGTNGRTDLKSANTIATMNNDLRTSLRHEFPYEQLVALVTDGMMPSLGDFRTVPCEDVSSSGVAFLLEKEPDTDECVVALGKAQHLTYLCARVVHVRQVPHKGQLRYRVGCQFTGRARFERSTFSVVRVDDDPDQNAPVVEKEEAATAVPHVQKGNEHHG